MTLPIPLRVLAFLESLSEAEPDDGDFMDDEEELDEDAYPVSTQHGMVRRFRAMRARFVQPGGIFGEQGLPENVKASSFTVGDTKPKSDVRSLRTLKPMTGKVLEVGTTHRGRYLCGWVAIDDAFFGIASSSLILEDVTGYLVEIAAYGLVDPELPPHERQRILSRQFAKGQPIVVIEPYYKVRMDGSEGVRIEQAEELLPWRDIPTDLMSWKELGNEFYTQNEDTGALACYQRALKTDHSEVRTLVLLLTNLAACRLKMGDLGTAIQLAGAAVHLDPTYDKGWFYLVSAAAESGLESLATQTVARARRVLPGFAFEKPLRAGASSNRTEKHPQFRSFAEWSMKLETPGSVLIEVGVAGDTKSADEWCKEGLVYFTMGEYGAAERCYRKGIASSQLSRQYVSVVLNNVAAVHLKACRKTSCDGGESENSEDEVTRGEAALLNCTVAGIIDPLNFKAWLRRDRCLQNLGFTHENCIRDLQTIRTSVVSMMVFSEETMGRLNEFQQSMDAEIRQRSPSSDSDQGLPWEEQRKPSCEGYEDAFSWESSSEENQFAGVSLGDEANIDETIARMDGFVRRMRSVYATARSQSSPLLQDMPRDIKMFYQDPPPQIHTEYPELRGWPDGIDPVFASKVLHLTCLQATLSPWVGVHQMRNGTYFEGLTVVDRIKRWHGIGAFEIIRKRGTTKYGDIVDGREAQSDFVPTYEARTRSSFVNSPNRPEFYFFGSTHVAIGFNDFSSLLAATLSHESNRNSPLNWVGFEMSEFAVAKCKVVAHMLGSPRVSISSVMEVWLSSTWSETTLKDFRESVDAVLESLRGRSESRKVMSYLSHWKSDEPVSAAKARSEFFSNLWKHNKTAFSSLCSFRRVIDRLDLTNYMLSGEIRASASIMELMEKEEPNAAHARTKAPTETTQPEPKTKRHRKKNKKRNKKEKTVPIPTVAPLVGNVTMWNAPQGAPPLRDDIAFNAVEFTKLLEDYGEREKNQAGSCDQLSVVDLFITHIMKNLSRLRGLILEDKLTIEVNHGVVKAVRGEAANDPVNKALLARIALMRPRTMSWSNVVDCFLPEDFHDIARRCSAYGGCVHYGYSMNWPTQVCGASIIDFDPEDNKPMIDAVLDSAFGFENELMPEPLPTALKKLGLDKLLFLPFREHPLNGTALVLVVFFKGKWVKHFMKKGELTSGALQRLGMLNTPSNCGLQKGSMDLLEPSPLYRSSLTLFMSWCYDPFAHLVSADDPSQPSSAVGAALLAQLMEHLGM